MKQGYIVWNQTNYGTGYEFFGVYRSYEQAFRQFRKVIRKRYGKCPQGTYEEISDWVIDNTGLDCGDNIMISNFNNNEGA